jgi:hypothetical protein
VGERGRGRGGGEGRHLPDRQHLFHVLPAAKNDSYATRDAGMHCTLSIQYSIYISKVVFILSHF